MSDGDDGDQREDRPDLPEVKGGRVWVPDPSRPCPQCGDDSEQSERPSEVVEGERDGFVRHDWWCAECGAYVGGERSYEGPIPVRTHTGWEWH
jgi:ribosomal protein S27AE